jgi:hypothetical protein
MAMALPHYPGGLFHSGAPDLTLVTINTYNSIEYLRNMISKALNIDEQTVLILMKDYMYTGFPTYPAPTYIDKPFIKYEIKIPFTISEAEILTSIDSLTGELNLRLQHLYNYGIFAEKFEEHNNIRKKFFRDIKINNIIG